VATPLNGKNNLSVLLGEVLNVDLASNTVGAAAAPSSPLDKLCQDTLATLASPPGRIYENTV